MSAKILTFRRPGILSPCDGTQPICTGCLRMSAPRHLYHIKPAAKDGACPNRREA